MTTCKKNRKYFLSTLLFALCLLGLFLVRPVHAEEENLQDGELQTEDGNFIYRVENGDTISLVKYTGPKGAMLKIPETIDGKEVTTIETHFIKGQLFDGEDIGSDSLERQENIPSSIYIPKTVTHIEKDAISGFSGKLTISSSGKSLTLDDCALFANDFTSITLPKRVTKIGVCAVGFYEEWWDVPGADKYFKQIERYSYKVKGFSIYGSKGSAAEKYATKYGLLFNKKSIELCTLKYTSKRMCYYGKKVYKKYSLYDGEKKIPINTVYKNISKIGYSTVIITSKDKNYGGKIETWYPIYPANTKITKLKGKKKAFTVSLKKCAGNVKYQIMYNVERPGWNAPHAYWHYRYTTKLTKTIPVDVKGIYHVKVRTVGMFKDYNEEKGQLENCYYYGDWSPMRTVTVK